MFMRVQATNTLNHNNALENLLQADMPSIQNILFRYFLITYHSNDYVSLLKILILLASQPSLRIITHNYS